MDASGCWGGSPYVGRGSCWAANVASFLAVFVLSALVACGAQQRPDGGKGVLEVGAAAPELEGVDASGKRFRLSESRAAGAAKPAVVYFYPKDGTPGCTKEACAFRDAWSRFSDRGVVVFGVSRDSEASHAQFLKEHELPFPLVADESGTIQTAYGVPSHLGMAARITFLVDQAGRIAKVWPDVDPGVHADDVLKAIGQLEHSSAR
jgi:peroxiredoxin Q/BCP